MSITVPPHILERDSLIGGYLDAFCWELGKHLAHTGGQVPSPKLQRELASELHDFIAQALYEDFSADDVTERMSQAVIDRDLDRRFEQARRDG